jgi:hypothetical protein
MLPKHGMSAYQIGTMSHCAPVGQVFAPEVDAERAAIAAERNVNQPESAVEQPVARDLLEVARHGVVRGRTVIPEHPPDPQERCSDRQVRYSDAENQAVDRAALVTGPILIPAGWATEFVVRPAGACLKMRAAASIMESTVAIERCWRAPPRDVGGVVLIDPFRD